VHAIDDWSEPPADLGEIARALHPGDRQLLRACGWTLAAWAAGREIGLLPMLGAGELLAIKQQR
jgi:hypothetical protein